MHPNDIKALLDEYFILFNRVDFIADDPIAIPHLFTMKEDIEISALLTAILAWGQRKTIISKSMQLMQLMDNSPHNFIMNATEREMAVMLQFRHRTFNGDDCLWFVNALKKIYQSPGGLEHLFTSGFSKGGAYGAIELLFSEMTKTPHISRSEKHLARPSKGSAAKRINMFLRWMVRTDNHGVDFGIWKKIPTSDLICPLDVHSGRTARKFGLISRTANDWTAAKELTLRLKAFDPVDPVKYDFALFGAGINQSRF